MKIFLLVLLISPSLFAQEILPTPKLPTEDLESVPEVAPRGPSPVETVINDAQKLPETKIEAKRKKTADYREESLGSVMVGYQLITSWIPSKKTLSYTHIFNRKWSLEGEYSVSSIEAPIYGVDLGEIKERRYSLQMRRYWGNSFNFTFGPVYNDVKARLGSDILDSLGTEIKSSFRVQNLGLTVGMGNRWQWGNGFTLGLDWIRLNVPVLETAVKDNVLDDISKSSDRTDVKEVIRTLNRVPTFVLLGINLGYTF